MAEINHGPCSRDIEHREHFREYVLNDADPWHREHLGRLYDLWEAWNNLYFGGQMVPPYILLSEPSEPKRYGDCGTISGFGGRSQIRIRPSLLWGTHPHMKRKGNEEGYFLFVADILLHEMIHQFHQEITGQDEDSYHGHGPAFRDKCNEIGRKLNLPPVRTCKKRGKDEELPSCSQWPHDVRPESYYLGVYKPAKRRILFEEGYSFYQDIDLIIREIKNQRKIGWKNINKQDALKRIKDIMSLVEGTKQSNLEKLQEELEEREKEIEQLRHSLAITQKTSLDRATETYKLRDEIYQLKEQLTIYETKERKLIKKINDENMVSPEFKKAIHGVILAIHNERVAGWKNITKEAALKQVDVLADIVKIGK